jgi:peptide/nickel transport system substrate-binding protein
VVKAKALLEQVGWKDINNDGIREAQGVVGVKDGTPLKFETASIAGEQVRAQLLALVHAQWKEIGVQAEVRLVDVATMFSNMHPNNNFQSTYSYIGRTPDPDISALYLDRTKFNLKTNYTGYSNPKVDDLVQASLKTADQAKRKDLLWQAQAIIAEEQPMFFIGWRANTTAINKKLHGYLPCPGGNEMWNAYDWWLD